MKLLIVIMSAMAAMSMYVFVGASQAPQPQATDIQVVASDSAPQEVAASPRFAPSYVLEEVTAEELDVVVVDVDVIEFTEEEASNIFDSTE
jgi:hypothetical protein